MPLTAGGWLGGGGPVRAALGGAGGAEAGAGAGGAGPAGGGLAILVDAF